MVIITHLFVIKNIVQGGTDGKTTDFLAFFIFRMLSPTCLNSQINSPAGYRLLVITDFRYCEPSILVSQLLYFSFDQSHASTQTFTLLIQLPREKLPYGLQGFLFKQTWTQDHYVIPQHRPCPNPAKIWHSIRSQYTIVLPLLFQNKITILRLSLFFQNPVQYVSSQ